MTMTEEANATSTGSVGSDDSLVLIETTDLPPPTTEAPVVVPVSVPATQSSETNPSVAQTYSYDSEESDQQGTPIIATDVQIVDDIPPSVSSFSIQGDTTGEEGGNTDDSNDKDEEAAREHKVGAGIAVGIVAAPFCGPVLAVVAGVAAAYGTSQPGVAGDACRAAGDVAMVAKEKAIAVDKKHDIMNKTKEGANQLVDRARDANERHRIFEKMKKIVACTLKNVAAALQFAADKMKESRNQNKAAASATTAYEKVPVGVHEG